MSFKIDKNTAFMAIAVVAILIVGGLIYADSSNVLPNFFGPSQKEIGQKAVDYINNNNLANSQASLVDVSEMDGLLKLKIKIGENEYDSYVTKNGRYLFPQGIEMSGSKETPDNSTSQKDALTCDTITKTDKPILEAYIVSRCPFGLQMQRMIDDAIKSIPDLANSIKVRYMGSVSADGKKIEAMHGEAEATENLRQICIREEQPAKYWSYVACQMKAGDTAGCEKSTGVDSAKLSACVSTPSKGVAYAKEDFDLSAKYGVTGSPTLILGGATIEEFGSDNQPIFGSARSSDELKTIVCCASKSQPSFCSAKLNTAQAATSFSEVYASSAGSNSGGAAGCEAAQ